MYGQQKPGSFFKLATVSTCSEQKKEITKNKNQVYAYSHDVGPPLLSGAADAAGQSRRPQIYASAARDLIYPATIDTIPSLQRYMRTWRIAEQPTVSLKRGPKTSPSTPWREAKEPLVKKRKKGKKKGTERLGCVYRRERDSKKKKAYEQIRPLHVHLSSLTKVKKK